MIRKIVIDLDGTLLNHDHQIGDRTKEVLQALSRQGMQLVIATGRHYQDVKKIAQQLEVPVSLITSNGARIHDGHGKLLFENHIPEKLAQQVLSLSQTHCVHRNIYQGDYWLVEEPNKPLLAIHHASGFEYEIVDFSKLECSQIDKFYFNADYLTLVPLEHQIRSQFGGQLSITFSTEIYLEVMNLGVSKGAALSKLCSDNQLQACEVMAFGDGLNDQDMLQWVGAPVVMENAHPELKKVVPYAAQATSNADEGVALFLQQKFF